MRFFRIVGWVLLSFMVLIAGVVLIALWSLDMPEGSAGNERQERLAVARQVCQQIIEDNLNDPSSAEWGNIFLWPAGYDVEDERRILVQPEIRASNAFGAIINTRFQCAFRIDTAGELSFESFNEY